MEGNAKFALFILGNTLVLYAGHLGIYATLVRFFGIAPPGVKRILFWGLSALAVSFIPCAMLVRTFPGGLTGFLYTASAFWLGLFFYLLMAAALSWTVFLGSRAIGFHVNMKMLLGAMSATAACLCLWGAWQAGRPEVRRLSVAVKDLPAQWQGKTIVQLSDVHLGAIRTPRFMERVAETVNRLAPALILITGDLFDGMGGCLQDFVGPLNQLKATHGIFFVTGNHEGYLGIKKPLAVLKQTDIRVLDNEVASVNGLQIVGIRFPDHTLTADVRHLLLVSGAYTPETPSLLLYHTPTNIDATNHSRDVQQSTSYWRPDTVMTLAKSVGIDLQLSGHTHQGQFFPFTWLTRYIFNGYDYGLHRDGDFQIYVTSGTGTWGPPMRIGSASEIPAIRLEAAP